MKDSILQFADQLAFVPEIKNGPVYGEGKHLVLGGMGGSHLSAGLLKLYDPFTEVYIHRDYGIPPLSQQVLATSVLVASSYSGNTEETLDFLEHSLRLGLRPAVITSGGTLLRRAEEERLPYVQIPATVIQPRVAVGLSLVALASLTGDKTLSTELQRLSSLLKPSLYEEEGERVAEALQGFTPLVYASAKNETLAYNWKIKINETAKIHAFCNVFSELNHNELAGFGNVSKRPSSAFKVLLVRDNFDHERIQKRMDITASLCKEKGIETFSINLVGESVLERAFRSLLVADWASYHLAIAYGANPDTNELVEEFKKRVASSV